ncbi:hypothetical protein Godav_006663 [Gossypium davidsonii]|uniref:Uncharacterized protein n=1 Tax=Gossypium davidsonii TaxID=34287 RepID=A0A7J8S5Z3_GOSDV|nr:hypothetical protein [Gossypium davidsonii]
MSDWGPVFVAMVLFVLLTPGLLFQVPGHHRCVEFGNFKTSGASVLIHSLLYFGLICVFLLAVKVHLVELWPMLITVTDALISNKEEGSWVMNDVIHISHFLISIIHA